jgi:tetratricopeptide (TPR) repeat protein
MAERTLYLPSVGAALIAGWAAYWLLERAPRPAAALATACAVAFAARTWTRTPVWHDDIALTLAALHDSPTSYKAHHAAGVLFAQTGHWTEAANEYRYARWLFPLDVEPYRGGAEAALVVHDYDGAAALLDSARRLVPRRFSPWIRLADVRFKQERWREASALAFGAYEMSPDSLRALGIAINANVRAAISERLHPSSRAASPIIRVTSGSAGSPCTSLGYRENHERDFRRAGPLAALGRRESRDHCRSVLRERVGQRVRAG